MCSCDLGLIDPAQILPRAHNCYSRSMKPTLNDTQFDPSSSPIFTYTLISLSSFSFSSLQRQINIKFSIVTFIRLIYDQPPYLYFSARLLSNFVASLILPSLSRLSSLSSLSSLINLLTCPLPSGFLPSYPVYCFYLRIPSYFHLSLNVAWSQFENTHCFQPVYQLKSLTAYQKSYLALFFSITATLKCF